MNKHQEYLVSVYIDWVNNYLTVGKMSDDYGIDISCLHAMIDEGERLNNHID